MGNTQNQNYFAQLPDYVQQEFARKTLAFIRRIQDNDPGTWRKIQAMAAANAAREQG